MIFKNYTERKNHDDFLIAVVLVKGSILQNYTWFSHNTSSLYNMKLIIMFVLCHKKCLLAVFWPRFLLFLF